MSRRSDRSVSVVVPPNLAPLTDEDPRTVGDYVLIGRVGAGHTGTVYTAINPAAMSNSLVAVKILDPELVRDLLARERLDQRLRTIAAVDGHFGVSPLEFDAYAPQPWLALPYIPGTSLAQFVRKRGALSPGMLIALSAGLAEALASLHNADVSHGSLKPNNVMLSSSGPRVLDCAIANGPAAARHSATWLSPERHAGGSPSPADDVFAWGAVVAFAGTGRMPFGDGEPEEITERVTLEDPDLEGLPGELEPLVRRALSKEAEDRPSVRELIGSALAAWEASFAQEAREDEDVEVGSAEGAAASTTAVDRLLSREWHGIVEPTGLPRVFYIASGRSARSGARISRIPLLAAGAVLALALVGGGVWTGVNALTGNSAEPTAAEETDDDPDGASGTPDTSDAPDGPVVVRFGVEEQPNPADGPWVYTVVERDEDAAEDGADWNEQWEDASGDEPLEARIDPGAEVLCARYCHNPGTVTVDDDGRGAWEGLTGQDFISYLSYGDVVIAEVEFDDEDSDDGLPVIVAITELYEP